MRASRLVSLLLVLQTRGQLTAAELADRLEVSERTVQRDAQALAAAGVPIVSVRGPAGGYRLERGYRTKLTGLDAVEAEALFVGPAAELGLGRELAAARLKLLASLPAELQDRAGRAARLFHVEHVAGFARRPRPPSAGARRCALAGPPTRHPLPGGRRGRLAPAPPARAHPQGRSLVPARATPRGGARVPRVTDRVRAGAGGGVDSSTRLRPRRRLGDRSEAFERSRA